MDIRPGGRARNYLLYAIGEMALDVIGILLALQINNWNEWRRGEEIKKRMLIDLIFEPETVQSRLTGRVVTLIPLSIMDVRLFILRNSKYGYKTIELSMTIKLE
jgi:hypothetical protein